MRQANFAIREIRSNLQVNPARLKIIDRTSAVEAIKELSEEDLRFLNRLIVDRLQLLSQIRNLNLMANFSVGDRVEFDAPEGLLEGTVLRVNQKTVGVATNDGRQWKISPNFLRIKE